MKTGAHQFLNPLAPSSMKPLVEGKFKGFTIHLPHTEGYKDIRWSKVKYSEKDIDEFINGSAGGSGTGWKAWQDADNLPKWLLNAIRSQMNKKNFTGPVIKAYETVMQRIKDGTWKEIKLTPQKYETGSGMWHQSKRGDETSQTLDPKYWK